MPKVKKKPELKCSWGCGASVVGRRCRICVACIDKRDAKNAAIDAGKAVYVPPQDRPGHRFYERRAKMKGKPRSKAQLAATERMRARRKADSEAKKGSRTNDLTK